MRKNVDNTTPKYYFDEQDQPVLVINSGDEITSVLHDTYTGQLKSEKDIRPNIDTRALTPLIGPIQVNNAIPGQSLRVEVIQLDVVSPGIMPLTKGMGIVGEKVEETTTRIFDLSDDRIKFSSDIFLPITPMIGTIGVAPKGDRVRAFTPGDFGGNMDFKGVKKGSVLYLPIFVPGAMMYFGDLHALQGDGELDGTGMEAAGKIHLRVNTVENLPIKRPLVISDGIASFVASHRSIEQAVKIAIEDTLSFLMDVRFLNFSDAYRLVSLVGDIRICQLVNPQVTVRLDFPNSILKISE